ncbi:MAG: hypothetical protein ACW987_20130 [Candidatus Thorarchaeota archaeon]|jgi:hypothetical protein
MKPSEIARRVTRYPEAIRPGIGEQPNFPVGEMYGQEVFDLARAYLRLREAALALAYDDVNISFAFNTLMFALEESDNEVEV